MGKAEATVFHNDSTLGMMPRLVLRIKLACGHRIYELDGRVNMEKPVTQFSDNGFPELAC
jgi:hypothetical protein